MSEQLVTTVVDLPAEVLEAVDRLVAAGLADTRGALLALAVRRELAAFEERAIDDDLAAMANDPDYQREVDVLMDEFATADWEAFRLAEEST